MPPTDPSLAQSGCTDCVNKYGKNCCSYAVLLPGSWCSKDGRNMEIAPPDVFDKIIRDLKVMNLPKTGQRLCDMQELDLVDVCMLRLDQDSLRKCLKLARENKLPRDSNRIMKLLKDAEKS